VLSTTLPRLSNRLFPNLAGHLNTDSTAHITVHYPSSRQRLYIRSTLEAMALRVYPHHLPLVFRFFFLVNKTFFPPCILTSLLSHGIFFQQREHLAPCRPRTASLSSSVHSTRIPSNWVWARRREQTYTAHESALARACRPSGWALVQRRMARKRHGKASCMPIDSLSPSSQIESSLMF
jgi:hypothetical protein